MPTVRFNGRVFPFVYDISVSGHPKVTWVDDETGVTFKFIITIQKGDIQIDCHVEPYNESKDLTSLFIRAYDVTRTSLDLTAFNTGYGLTLLIETYTGVSGETRPFVVNDLQLASLCTAFSGKPAKPGERNSFDTVLNIALSDWKIGHSLRELIEAITIPHQSTTNCARAIEGLRTLIAPSGIDRKKAWVVFGDALRLAKSYTDLVTDSSKEHRHGNRIRIPASITTEVVRRSWIIMDRFLEYKKRGGTPLPESEFPLLTG
jgi:hypothetical protein